MKNKPHHALSPDGLPIQPHPFKSWQAASDGLDLWIKRFTRLGHYMTHRGRRIPLAELRQYCRIEEVE